MENWCFPIVEKTLESPLDNNEIKPVNPKGNQSWIFIGRTDDEAETPISGHLMQRVNFLEKTWCWERLKAGGEGDEMVGWQHRLNGHEFEQALRVGDGQGGLACYSPWGHKESDTTEWLNWAEGLGLESILPLKINFIRRNKQMRLRNCGKGLTFFQKTTKGKWWACV